MQGVAARDVLDDQVCAAEFTQRRPYVPQRLAAEAGRRRCGDVRARVQPEQPEQAGGRGAQGVVRPGEHRSDVGGGVLAGESVQPVAGVVQTGGERPQGQAGMCDGMRGHDREGQR
jgi:hypothetical protein